MRTTLALLTASLVGTTFLALSGCAAPARHPANPRGIADPRGPLDPRGPGGMGTPRPGPR